MLKRLIRRLGLGDFGRNQEGSVKILTVLMAMPLLLLVGTAVDTAEIYRAKTNFQSAVDAGALMAAKTFAATGDPDLATQTGTEVFDANLGNVAPSVGTIAFNMGNGDCSVDGVTASATLRHRVFFDMIHKVASNRGDPEHITLNTETVVKCGNDTIEIAMVLDNSGSMGKNSKIQTLRSAASNLVNTLHTTMSNATRPEPLRFSLVPFAATVNVGAGNRGAGWLDMSGRSSIHHEHLNWAEDPNAIEVAGTYQTAGGAPLTRFTLYDNLPGISWAGCVEQMPYPYHTKDEEPSIGTPDTLVVPTFAPDTPDNWTGDFEQILTVSAGKETCVDFQSRYYWSRGRRRTRSIRRCEQWTGTPGETGQQHTQDPDYRPHWDDRVEYRRGVYIGADPSGGAAWVNGNAINEETYQNNYLEDDHNFPIVLGNARQPSYTGSGGDQYKRQKWTWKYFQDLTGDNPSPRDVNANRSGIPDVVGLPGGPNNACTTTALTELSPTKSTVINAINDMQAEGATNVQQGLAWGWKTLSPGEPFTSGRSYSKTDNRKILILMTDGNNTYYPSDYFYNGYSTQNKSYYGAHGHTQNDRIFDGFTAIANPDHEFDAFRQAMDSHMTKTCQNVKAAGITMYTIAFNVPNGSSVKTMLEQCASTELGGTKLYFDANDNATLVATFQKIAEKLSELAISK